MKKSPAPKSQPSRNTQFVLGTLAGVLFASAVVWALIPSKPDATPQAVVAPASAAAAMTPAEDHTGHDHPEFARMSVDDLKASMDRGEVTILDVRDAESYIASHIPGSLHIPLARVEGEIPHLPKGKLVVTYCTCPAEETSGVAAAILERGGVKAAALQGGYAEWQRRGFALASGAR